MAEKTSLCKHPNTCLLNSIKGFIRGAIIGLGVRAIITLIMSLIKRTLFKNPASLLKMFSKDNMRLVCFLSGMVGIQRSVLCILRRLTNDEKISSFCAGFASGIPLMFEETENRVMFSLYMLVRAGDAFCKFLVNKRIVPKIPKLIEIVYVASLSTLIYIRVYHPDAVNRGFSNLMGRIVMWPNDIVYIDMTGYFDKLTKKR